MDFNIFNIFKTTGIAAFAGLPILPINVRATCCRHASAFSSFRLSIKVGIATSIFSIDCNETEAALAMCCFSLAIAFAKLGIASGPIFAMAAAM
ncbi:MAG: hypothetical protein O3A00_12045 [Planctomycetota bacterium]|nr:hypothetical protein [Planctomycetota bacterium]